MIYNKQESLKLMARKLVSLVQNHKMGKLQLPLVRLHALDSLELPQPPNRIWF
jgi:hypothetical protein